MPGKRPLCTSTPLIDALESIPKRARTELESSQHQLSSFRITPTGPQDSDMQPDELTLMLSLSLRNQLVAGLNRISEMLSGKSATPAERVNLFNENNDLAKRLMTLPVYLTTKQTHEQQLNEELDDFLVRNVQEVPKQPEHYHPFGITGEPETLFSETIDTSPQKKLNDTVHKEASTSTTPFKKVLLAITDKITPCSPQVQGSSPGPTTRASARTSSSAKKGRKDQKATNGRAGDLAKGPANDQKATDLPSPMDGLADGRTDGLANGAAKGLANGAAKGPAKSPANGSAKAPAKDFIADLSVVLAEDGSADGLANGLPDDLSADLAAFLAEPDEICFPNSEIQHRTNQLYPLTGQMSWRMKNMLEFFQLKAACTSPPIHICDQDGQVFRFKLWLNPKYLKTKTDNPKSIDLFIECQSPAEQWTCPVKGHLRLVNQRSLDEMDDDDNSMHRLVPIEYKFDQDRTVAGLPNLISYRLLTKPQNGFYLNDSIVFEFEVNIQPS